MTDTKRINALEWIIIAIGAIALIAFLFTIQIGINVDDLNDRVATLEASTPAPYPILPPVIQ